MATCVWRGEVLSPRRFLDIMGLCEPLVIALSQVSTFPGFQRTKRLTISARCKPCFFTDLRNRATVRANGHGTLSQCRPPEYAEARQLSLSCPLLSQISGITRLCEPLLMALRQGVALHDWQKLFNSAQPSSPASPDLRKSCHLTSHETWRSLETL